MGNQWADEAIYGGRKPPSLFTRLLRFASRCFCRLSRTAFMVIGTAAITLLVLLSLGDKEIQTMQSLQSEAETQVQHFVDKTVVPSGKKALRVMKDWQQDKTDSSVEVEPNDADEKDKDAQKQFISYRF